MELEEVWMRIYFYTVTTYLEDRFGYAVVLYFVVCRNHIKTLNVHSHNNTIIKIIMTNILTANAAARQQADIIQCNIVDIEVTIGCFK